jgi:predicted acetyltransferase
VTVIEIVDAAEAQRDVLRHLGELYQYDFSEFDGEDVGDDGRYGFEHLERCWIEPDRVPLLVRVDGHWAGFVLVHTGTPHDIAEFFVMRKFRRSGVGTYVARAVFARFPGDWQVRQVRQNPRASEFWRRAIPVPFEEDANEEGPVQQFSVEGS